MSAYVITVDFRLKPGAMASFRQLIDDNAQASARGEPGCRRFDVLTPKLDANAAARGDMGRFERTDVAFHYVLARITRNPIFTAVHDALVEWLTSQRTITLRAPGAAEAAFEAHRRIFEGVAAREPEAAALAMDEHLKEVAALMARAKETGHGAARHSR